MSILIGYIIFSLVCHFFYLSVHGARPKLVTKSLLHRGETGNGRSAVLQGAKV